MSYASLPPAQMGLPEIIPDLIGLAGTLVLVLILVALAGFVYKSLSGGIEWPEDEPADEDALRRGDEDDEWDYY
jgi:hypothetical protein